MIRAAFTFSGGAAHWTGGFNYLRNAFRVLRRHASAQVRPVLFFSPETRPQDVEALAAELVEPPVAADWLAAPLRGRRFLRSVLLGADASAAAAFARHRIDVAFEAGEYFGSSFPLPTLTWVADFQSHHLPQFFSWQARWRTYLGRHLQLSGRRLILLSSQDAAGDCQRFYPSSKGRTTVVRFAVSRPDEALQVDDEVLQRHQLPPRYFYLPNQFWQHKNHKVVIEALALVRASAPDVAVVSSGSPVDHRDPGHFDRLKARVAELGLVAEFRFAGLVPAADVPQLALHSVAVVNPSLFEGWSTTVEEAKTLGVPLVLSSIPVHREQAGDTATYFDPHSPESCARALLGAWNSAQQPPAERLQASAESAEQRTREFAGRLYEALSRAANLDSPA